MALVRRIHDPQKVLQGYSQGTVGLLQGTHGRLALADQTCGATAPVRRAHGSSRTAFDLGYTAPLLLATAMLFAAAGRGGDSLGTPGYYEGYVKGTPREGPGSRRRWAGGGKVL